MADVLATMAQIQGGRAIQEISIEFDQVLEAVRTAGGKGELVIKLQVEGKSWDPATNQLREVGVTHTVTSKRPKRKLGSSTFFVTRGGELTRNNPEQAEMFDETFEVNATRREV
jgi:hypothetical protein